MHESNLVRAIRRPSAAVSAAAVALAVVTTASDLAAQFGQPPAEPEWATLEGSVWDSTTASPLAGARVMLLGTNIEGISAPNGTFRIDSIPPGAYPVSFTHARVEGTGFSIAARAINLPPNGDVFLDLSIPSTATLLASECVEDAADPAAGALVGYVRDAGTGVPLPRAQLTLTWRSIETEARSQWDGMWLACGIPNSAPVTAEVVFPGREPETFTVQGSDDAVRRMDIDLASGTTGVILGQVQDAETDRPVADAEVVLGGRTVVSDQDGRFMISELDPGPYEIAISHIAYGEDVDEVRVPDDEQVLDLTVRLSPRAIELEPIVVTATSEEVRTRLAMGTSYAGMEFLEIQDALDRVTDMASLLRTARIPGLRVLVLEGGTCVELNRARGRTECTFPLLFVDGIRISNPGEYLSTLAPERVERFQVIPALEAGVLYGAGSQNGVLMIETRAGRYPVR